MGVGVMKATDRKQQGLAVVEMTLILPFLLLLLLGGIEYGCLFLRSQQITNAARQGARAAILPGATEGEVLTLVESLMTHANMSDYTAGVTLGTPTPQGRATVEVWVQVPTASVAIVNAPGFLPIPANLGASITMAVEGS